MQPGKRSQTIYGHVFSLRRSRIFDLVFTIYIMETCISEEVPVQHTKTALCNPEEVWPVASQCLLHVLLLHEQQSQVMQNILAPHLHMQMKYYH